MASLALPSPTGGGGTAASLTLPFPTGRGETTAGTRPRWGAALPGERFVSEAIIPAPGAADVRALARREPGLPSAFTWRGKLHAVAALLESWKTFDRPGPHAYVRRHWFRVRAVSGEIMTLYCERQTRNRRRPKACWWLYSIRSR